MRVKFKKGKQREFFLFILQALNCPSLRALNQFGFEIPYPTLKSYFSERRLMPYEFFANLCTLAKVKKEDFDVELVADNWGQVKGGKNGKRK